MSLLSERPSPLHGSTRDRAARPDEPTAAPAPRSGRVPVGLTPAVLGLSLVVVGAAAAHPALLLLGLGGAATALVRRWLPMDLAVPAGAFVLLLAALSAGSAAAWLHVDLLAAPNGLLAGYLVFAAGVLLHALLRPVRRTPRRQSVWARLGMLPAGLAVAIAVLQSLSMGVAKSWAFWGTDLTRHITTIKALQDVGALDYSTSSYPRGLHMLAALVSVPARPSGRVALLEYDLQLGAALTWLALALMMWTGAAVALRVSDRLGLHPACAGLAAALVGAGALLTNTFLLSFVYLGAAPSLVAVAVLHAVPLALVAFPGRDHRLARTVVVCATAALLLAHLWQALVLAPVVACAVLVVRDLIRLPQDVRHARTRRPLLLAVLAAAAAGLLALPPLVGVQQAAGLGYAAVPGGLGGEPWRLLVPGLVVVAGIALLRRHDGWALGYAAMAAGLLATTALLLRGTGEPLGLTQYYPLKSLWFLTLFLAPLLATVTAAAAGVVACAGWRLLGRTGPLSTVLRATAVATVLGPVLALWLGFLLGVDGAAAGTWHRAVPAPADNRASTDELSAVRFDIAARFGSPDRREVVVPYEIGSAAFDPLGTAVISLLLTFQTGQPEMRFGPADVCDQVATVARDRPALVISQLPVRDVEQAMNDAGCGGRARVVRVPNTGYLD